MSINLQSSPCLIGKSFIPTSDINSNTLPRSHKFCTLLFIKCPFEQLSNRADQNTVVEVKYLHAEFFTVGNLTTKTLFRTYSIQALKQKTPKASSIQLHWQLELTLCYSVWHENQGAEASHPASSPTQKSWREIPNPCLWSLKLTCAMKMSKTHLRPCNWHKRDL